jgi:DNA-directed RNA polymerase specialized sigma24 family protein
MAEEDSMEDRTATTPAEQGVVHLIGRALLTAHLLTGSLQQAEKATREAIDSWNSGEDPEEAVFQNVLNAAARAPAGPNPNNSDTSDSSLPNELIAVFRLAPQLRRCFVLRIVVGLPAKVCARLLHLQSEQVDEYTSAALQCLSDT